MQWHQLDHLDHMQKICTSLQTDNHTNIPITQFFTSQMLFLTPNERQSTEGKSQFKQTYIEPANGENAPHNCEKHTPVQRPFVRDYPGKPVPER